MLIFGAGGLGIRRAVYNRAGRARGSRARRLDHAGRFFGGARGWIGAGDQLKRRPERRREATGGHDRDGCAKSKS